MVEYPSDTGSVRKMKIYINKKGSALLTVLMVMTILVVVGLGVFSNSINNLNTTDVVTINERSYYASENAAQIAVSTIKNEVNKYYMTMMAATSTSAYQSLYDNFFTYLQGRLVGSGSILSSPDFVESELDGKTTLTCTMATPSMQASGYLGTTFTVTATTTIEGVEREVVSKLRVDAAPLQFQWTSAPPVTDYVLLSGGDVKTNAEYLQAVGSAILSGTVTNPSYFSATSLSENDSSVNDILTWQLYYDQFDKSIANPPMPPTMTSDEADVAYPWYHSLGPGEFPGNKVNNQKIYFTGGGEIKNQTVKNCDIYVQGGGLNITNSTFEGTNIYVEGLINIANGTEFLSGSNPNIIYTGGDLIINCNTIIISDTAMTAEGNMMFHSHASSKNDIIENSSFYTNSSISITGNSSQCIDSINNCTFEAPNGYISIVTASMRSGNKLSAGGNITIMTRGMENTDIYSDGDISINGSSMTSAHASLTYSTGCKIVAKNNLTIDTANFENSYFYAGQETIINFFNEYYMKNCIMYSEGDINWNHNWWSGSFIASQSTLLYTNSDFNYHVHYDSAAFAVTQGLQIMAKGDINNSSGSEYLKFGQGSNMDFDALHSMIGAPNSHTGSLAQALADAGFEHELPEPNIFLPYYTEVFISEIYD